MRNRIPLLLPALAPPGAGRFFVDGAPDPAAGSIGSDTSGPTFADARATPQYWWDRAEEARRMAALMTDEKAKRTMEEVAGGYTRLARQAEQSQD
jgi:hypothetical protein